MKKCLLHKCSAHCCYNIAFEHNELERFASQIVNPVIGFTPFGGVKIAMTSWDIEYNKCPFLRNDLKCNIYENRPDVCRKMGEIPELPCEYFKDTSEKLTPLVRATQKLEKVTVGNQSEVEVHTRFVL